MSAETRPGLGVVLDGLVVAGVFLSKRGRQRGLPGRPDLRYDLARKLRYV
jgi:hypothetical protein